MEVGRVPGEVDDGHIRTRLGTALRAAMKARDTAAVSGLRSALAAIANAEAVPIPADSAAPAESMHQQNASKASGRYGRRPEGSSAVVARKPAARQRGLGAGGQAEHNASKASGRYGRRPEGSSAVVAPKPAARQRGLGAGGQAEHIAGGTAGLGTGEASRRALTDEELAGIVQAEIAERHRAAQQYQATGHPDRAALLRREAQAIQSALGS